MPDEDSWSRSLTLRISPADLWDLMWRPETQARWLGSASAIELQAKRRCVLCDEAGAWRTVIVVRAVRPSEVALAAAPSGDGQGEEITLALAAGKEAGHTVLTVRQSPVAVDRKVEVERFWTRRLELLEQLVGSVDRRREAAKQAVVVIHGIGEQQPGDTLRALVASGVITDPAGAPSASWVKPDRLSDSFELRKVTFKGSDDGAFPSTDVFELYWAHMIRDTTLGQVVAWTRGLLLRRDVPRPLRPAWTALWLLMLVAVAAVVATAFGELAWLKGGAVVVGASLIWRFVLRGVLMKIVGDAPRYLVALPENIALRQEIRAAGVDLVKRLHRDGYDRIVILGHSLGSVIAYDIVTNAWIAMNTMHRRPHDATFTQAVALERRLTQSPGVDEAQGLQHAAWRESRANTQPWLVTDLVTVGSPLTYADYLMADGRASFAKLVADRVLPTCPPVTETEAKSGHVRVTYDRGYASPFRPKSSTFRTFHHAAPFAVTRWTNLYFKVGRWGLVGDIVGGPVAPMFGPWVRDVELPPPRRRIAHTWYWEPVKPPDAHLAALRLALGLRARADVIALLKLVPPYALVFRGTPDRRS